MFVIEMLENGIWIKSSTHTLKIDAETQLARFAKFGRQLSEMRIVEQVNA